MKLKLNNKTKKWCYFETKFNVMVGVVMTFHYVYSEGKVLDLSPHKSWFQKYGKPVKLLDRKIELDS